MDGYEPCESKVRARLMKDLGSGTVAMAVEPLSPGRCARGHTPPETGASRIGSPSVKGTRMT